MNNLLSILPTYTFVSAQLTEQFKLLLETEPSLFSRNQSIYAFNISCGSELCKLARIISLASKQISDEDKKGVIKDITDTIINISHPTDRVKLVVAQSLINHFNFTTSKALFESVDLKDVCDTNSYKYYINIARHFRPSSDIWKMITHVYKHNPDVIDLFSETAHFYQLQKKLDDAIKFMEQDLVLGRQSTAWTIRYINILIQTNMKDKALKLTQCIDTPSKESTLLECNEEIKKRLANTSFNKLPIDAKILLLKHKFNIGNKSYVKKHINRVPPSKMNHPVLFDELFMLSLRLGTYETSKRILDVGQNLYPNHNSLKLYQSLIKHISGHPLEAIKCINNAQQDCGKTIFWKSYYLFLSQQYDVGYDFLKQQPINELKLSFMLNLMMALFLRNLNRVSEAEEYHHKAIKPPYISACWIAFLEYARTLFYTGNHKKAMGILNLGKEKCSDIDNLCSFYLQIIDTNTDINLNNSHILYLNNAKNNNKPFFHYSFLATLWMIKIISSRKGLRGFKLHIPSNMIPAYRPFLKNIIRSQCKNSDMNALTNRPSFLTHHSMERQMLTSELDHILYRKG